MRILSIAAASLLLAAGAADAATITINTLTNTIVQDFSDGDDIPRADFSGGPEDASAGGAIVTWESTNTFSVFSGYTCSYSLVDNGDWFGDDGNRDGFVGLNSQSGAMTFTFDTPVAGVGGFVNYSVFNGSPDGDTPTLSIFDGGGTLLETFDLFNDAPIDTPAQSNAGAFRGFSRAQADIASFELSGAFIVLDDLTFTDEVASSVIPVPAALPLMLSAMGGLALIARRRAR